IPHLDSIHAPIGDARDHSYLTVTHQMSLWWMFTSLLMLGGYVLLAVGYTVRTFKKPSLALFFPSLATIANIELAGVFLVSYLLFLVTFNVMKAGKRRESLAVLTYFVLLSSQLLTTWGLLTKALTSFLLGVTIRGITFFPSLLVFLTSGKE
ncbi:MAG: hypothetical protein GWO20_02690, partial [Candidatus Korarchaeota archaeon]|nr:hypothetical protein [Candidatus Korarchaeota archaeon]NIU82375.1 hypothetical protein [Candidatus Thorarchaeota archaeon]NIW12842.1 hypothetical protein [Candidatus Thorarchaeota archaeon]NIW51043.1 hypothetical protein [Candidatus Korarchaeota archaeon]